MPPLAPFACSDPVPRSVLASSAMLPPDPPPAPRTPHGHTKMWHDTENQQRAAQTHSLHTVPHVLEGRHSRAAHLGQHSQPHYTMPITHTPPPHTPPHVPVSPDPAPVPAAPFTRTVPLISAYVVTVAFASTTIAPPPLPPALVDDTPPDPCTHTCTQHHESHPTTRLPKPPPPTPTHPSPPYPPLPTTLPQSRHLDKMDPLPPPHNDSSTAYP